MLRTDALAVFSPKKTHVARSPSIRPRMPPGRKTLALRLWASSRSRASRVAGAGSSEAPTGGVTLCFFAAQAVPCTRLRRSRLVERSAAPASPLLPSPAGRRALPLRHQWLRLRRSAASLRTSFSPLRKRGTRRSCRRSGYVVIRALAATRSSGQTACSSRSLAVESA